MTRAQDEILRGNWIVHGVGSKNTAGVFGQSQTGPGVYGNGACGGVFESNSGGPQLKLLPSPTPLQQCNARQNGQAGDLYLYSESNGQLGTTALWLRLGTPAGTNVPAWAEIPPGPTTVGGI